MNGLASAGGMSVKDTIDWIIAEHRAELMEALNITIKLKVTASLGTHDSTPYSAGYGTVYVNDQQKARTGGESLAMNGGAKEWNTSFKLT